MMSYDKFGFDGAGERRAHPGARGAITRWFDGRTHAEGTRDGPGMACARKEEAQGRHVLVSRGDGG